MGRAIDIVERTWGWSVKREVEVMEIGELGVKEEPAVWGVSVVLALEGNHAGIYNK